MIYKAKDNETIWDLANKLYGSTSYAFQLAKDNGIGVNDDVLGIEFTYDETVKSEVQVPFMVSELPQNVPQIYYALSNQTIFDIALQTVGSLEIIVDLVKSSSLEYLNQETTNSRYEFTDSKNDVKKYLSITGRVIGNKPNYTEIGREHDDSFVRISYT